MVKYLRIAFISFALMLLSGSVRAGVTVQWPTPGTLIEKVTDGGTLAEFTTDKDYGMVTVELRNADALYHDLYDLPVRYMDNVSAGRVTCRTSTPGTDDSGNNPAWYAFRGDDYQLIIKCYLYPWDTRPDATATVSLKGSGIDHETFSTVKLTEITPNTITGVALNVEKGRLTSFRNNTVTLTFDGIVSELSAIRPGSIIGDKDPYVLYAEPVDGTSGKQWNILVPKFELEGELEYNFEIIARDRNGLRLNLNPRVSDHSLAIIYDVVEYNIAASDEPFLGSPVFSIDNGAEDVDYETTSITVTYPGASGYPPETVVQIDAELRCNDLTPPVAISAQGTLRDGIVLPVSLKDDRGYTLSIATARLYSEEKQYDPSIGDYVTTLQLLLTDNYSYTTVFYTAMRPNEDDEECPVSIMVSKVENYAAYLKVTGIENVLDKINNQSYMQVATVNINGEPSYYMADDLYGEALHSEFRVTAPGDVKDGTNVLIIPEGNLVIGVFPQNAFNPDVKYTNPKDITIRFKVGNGVVTGIETAGATDVRTTRMYNLLGQEVKEAKGIVVVNGKKRLYP